ncbi:MAG: tetratricopeptide repeat protein, partial [Clostridia bacterium]|nr:tetratricopeptide repeat protein [Clostridia bacterium]
MEKQEKIKNQEIQNIENQFQPLESESQFIQNNADFSTLQQAPIEAPKKKKAVKKVLAGIISVALISIIILAVVSFLNNNESFIYKRANKKAEKGDYIVAIENYKRILSYEDAYDKYLEVSFEYGKQLLEEKNYSEAATHFENASEKISEAKTYLSYSKGMEAMEKKDYDKAFEFFYELGDFLDSKVQVQEIWYQKAEAAYKKGDYNSASGWYSNAGNNHKDIEKKIQNSNLMLAEEDLKEGKLSDAWKEFSKLPKNLEFKGIKVSDRLALLRKHKDMVDLCGGWMGEGKMAVRQTHDSTGLWDQWDADFSLAPLTFRCIINKDGTYTFKGTATYIYYTNYSSISSYLKDKSDTISFSQKGKTIPSVLYDGKYIKL